MNELSLFAGAGGGVLGGLLLGWRTVCAVEIEPYPRAVLQQRQDDGILDPFPIWDDIATFNGRDWRGFVDVVTGGFPCQDISCAGKGAGLEGKRSGLWGEMARIIREVRPRYVLVENSPMLASRGLGVVLGDLAEMGFDARWGVLGAVDAGAPHKRERIWIVGNSYRNGESTLPFDARVARLPEHSAHNVAYPNMLRWARGGQHLSLPAKSATDRTSPFTDPSQSSRNTNGLANRLDRLKATGNGQVPAVVRLAWEVLTNES